jgi:hypothetical protein
MHIVDDGIFEGLGWTLIGDIYVVGFLELFGGGVEGEESEEVVGDVVLSIRLSKVPKAHSHNMLTWNPLRLKKMWCFS